MSVKLFNPLLFLQVKNKPNDGSVFCEFFLEQGIVMSSFYHNDFDFCAHPKLSNRHLKQKNTWRGFCWFLAPENSSQIVLPF
jgi:hypothetical protein